jgi:Tol biopolymer transport system component
MVFISTRTGYQEIWIRDMRSGEESALTATRSLKYAPRFSPDGSKVGFAVPGTWNAYVMSSTGGEAEMVCEGCGQVTGWSSDGKRILCNALDGKVYLLDLASRRKTALIARAGRWLCCGDYSPDDRWITFFDGTDARMHVVPSRGDEPAPDDASIEVLDDANGGQWSPDGNLVYTLSSRDGHVCVWAQRLDPLSRKPVGSPIAVFHSHDARLSLSNHNENSLTGGPGQVVFSMGERTGTIWMAEWKDR